jgi:hypothetical protein
VTDIWVCGCNQCSLAGDSKKKSEGATRKNKDRRATTERAGFSPARSGIASDHSSVSEKCR